MEKQQDTLERSNSANIVSAKFEDNFLKQPLDERIARCDNDEPAHVFMEWLPEHQPILEAGCGDGRWVSWFVKQGWKATGLDWSETLCTRARKGIPGGEFKSGDMRDMPFREGEFGSIVALGSIEHTAEGPEKSLAEFHRVLRPGGIAIITVPYLGSARKVSRFFKTPIRRLKATRLVMRISGKAGWQGRTLREARCKTRADWQADFLCDAKGWDFYQYLFTKNQLRPIIENQGFTILEEFITHRAEGIADNFGRIVAHFQHRLSKDSSSFLGRIIRSCFSVDRTGHMLCYLVRKE
jgi:SAM-dependent methyltransferase